MWDLRVSETSSFSEQWCSIYIYSRDISDQQEKFYLVFVDWWQKRVRRERKSYPLSRTIPVSRWPTSRQARVRTCCLFQSKVNAYRVSYLRFTYIIGNTCLCVYESASQCVCTCMCVRDGCCGCDAYDRKYKRIGGDPSGDRVRSRDKWRFRVGAAYMYSIVRFYVIYMNIHITNIRVDVCVARARMTSRGSRTAYFYAAAVLSETLSIHSPVFTVKS